MRPLRTTAIRILTGIIGNTQLSASPPSEKWRLAPPLVNCVGIRKITAAVLQVFGKRLGAGFAAHGVGTTVEHLVAAPLHEDLHYHRSTRHGFGPRLGHALKSTVIATNTHTGKHRPAMGRLSGHAAAGAFSQAALHAGSGAATAGIGLGADAGANVAREFWPRHHAHHRRRHA